MNRRSTSGETPVICLPVRALNRLIKCSTKKRYVFAPLRQARQGQFYDINTIVQVLAKFSFGHKGGKIAIGGSDDSGIGFNGFC